jgi:hypothetical protein
MRKKSSEQRNIGRSEDSDRPFQSIDPEQELEANLRSWRRDFDDEASDQWRRELDQELETADARNRAKINRWWAMWRQIVVIFLFVMGAILICFAVGVSLHTLLTIESGHRLEIAKWTLETMLGAFVAGLIGFVMVKSFEK